MNLFDNWLRLNVTGFFTEYTEYQQGITQLATGVITVNVPETDIWGFEMDFVAASSDNLVLSGGIGYAESELTEVLVINNPQNALVPLVDSSAFVGQRLPGTPEWNANLAATYTYPLTANGDLVVRADYSYTGDILRSLQQVGSTGEAQILADEFHLVNA